MGYSLKIEHPHFDEDKEFSVSDLGLVKNGSTLELDEEQERLFILNRGMTLEDAFKDNSLVTLSGNSLLSAEQTKELLPAPVEGIPGEEPAPVSNNDETVTNKTTPPGNDEGVDE